MIFFSFLLRVLFGFETAVGVKFSRNFVKIVNDSSFLKNF